MEGKRTLKINDILAGIQELAKSQGMYGRLYEDLMYLKDTLPEKWEEVKNMLEEQKFSNMLDFILWFEC